MPRPVQHQHDYGVTLQQLDAKIFESVSGQFLYMNQMTSCTIPRLAQGNATMTTLLYLTARPLGCLSLVKALVKSKRFPRHLSSHWQKGLRRFPILYHQWIELEDSEPPQCQRIQAVPWQRKASGLLSFTSCQY